jgi:hypothetical protein
MSWIVVQMWQHALCDIKDWKEPYINTMVVWTERLARRCEHVYKVTLCTKREVKSS